MDMQVGSVEKKIALEPPSLIRLNGMISNVPYTICKKQVNGLNDDSVLYISIYEVIYDIKIPLRYPVLIFC